MGDKNVNFPFLMSKSGRFLTKDGDFFLKVGEGKSHHWRKIETYLPASPKVYGMSTLDEVAEARFKKLETGEIVIKMGLKGNGATDNKKYKFGLK